MGLDNAYGIGSLKPGVCTSTSRPGSPFDGQVIYETDTDLVKAWNGSSWVTVGPTTVPADAITAIGQALITTNQLTSSTSYTDLSTVGPTVTVTTGTTAIAIWGGRYDDDTNAGADGYMSVAVSGASTVAASDNYAAYGFQGFGGNNQLPIVTSYRFTGLTAGSNTFTAKYRRVGGTNAGFAFRWLIVMAA